MASGFAAPMIDHDAREESVEPIQITLLSDQPIDLLSVAQNLLQDHQAAHDNLLGAHVLLDQVQDSGEKLVLVLEEVLDHFMLPQRNAEAFQSRNDEAKLELVEITFVILETIQNSQGILYQKLRSFYLHY